MANVKETLVRLLVLALALGLAVATSYVLGKINSPDILFIGTLIYREIIKEIRTMIGEKLEGEK